MPCHSSPSRLDTLSPALSLAIFILTLSHLFAGTAYRGHCRGTAISLFPSVIPTYLTALLLLPALCAHLALYVFTLFTHCQQRLPHSDDLVLALLALAALCWTGFLTAERRRRTVAVQLASIPCFGNGSHAANHQLMSQHKPAVLSACDQPFASVVPIASPVRSMSSATTVTVTEWSASSPSSERVENDSRRRSSTVGITRRKVLEFTCRTACTWVYGRPKRQAWPLNVVNTFRTMGKRFVLIKDETIQDGAGAMLLQPCFLQSKRLDKSLISNTVYNALNRSTVCVLHSWNKCFEAKLFHRFSQLPAVVNMLTGELCHDESRQIQERCYLTELLWAIITVEVLDYLQYKRKDLPMLSWLTALPKWLCQHDAAQIETEIDRVFARWKAGRCCGSSVAKPCDSDCCCHDASYRTGCGCPCPCICNCA